MTTHTFGSLFAGVGGFDMGMEAAGWTCTWQVEWDKQCQQVLRYHWPDVPKYGDVSTVSGYDLAPVDCITFGSPCQDLSVAGKRAGLDGNRSGLFFEAVRIIKEMRDATGFVYPRWAIWENVVGALSSNHGHDFAAVLDSLAEAGAVAIEWAVLDAQHFGIPQRRRRVFVISCFDPATAARCPDPLLPVSESLRRDTSAKRTKGEATPRSAAYGLGADSGIAGTLGTFTGGFRTTDLDGVGAYVVNAPTDDVVFPIQDGRGMEKMQNGFGIGKPDDPMYTLDATGAQAVAVVSVVGSHSGTWEVVNVPTDDVVGTLSGGGIQAHTTGRTPIRDYSYPCDGVVNAVTSKWAKGTGGPAGDECQNLVAVWTKSKRAQSAEDDETWIEGDVAPTLNAFDQGDTRATVLAVDLFNQTLTGDTHVPLRTAQGHGAPAVLAFGHTQGIDIQASDTSYPTLRRNGGGAEIQTATSAVRRLTPVECERLMGWPDNHTAVGVTENGDTVQLADSPRYRMIGNGVASPVAAWIGKHIMAVDGDQ